MYHRYPTIYWKPAGKEDKPEPYEVRRGHTDDVHDWLIVIIVQCKLSKFGFLLKPQECHVVLAGSLPTSFDYMAHSDWLF